MRERLERTYRQHRRGLFRLALSLTRCPQEAEDAVHEAFARMCKPGAMGGAPDDMTAYAFAAVRNAALDRLRQRPADLREMLVEPCLDGEGEPVERAEKNRAIAAAVDALPEDLRAVVFLRAFGDLNFREVAEILNAPLQTVVSRYRTGLEKLRPQLRKWL